MGFPAPEGLRPWNVTAEQRKRASIIRARGWPGDWVWRSSEWRIALCIDPLEAGAPAAFIENGKFFTCCEKSTTRAGYSANSAYALALENRIVRHGNLNQVGLAYKPKTISSKERENMQTLIRSLLEGEFEDLSEFFGGSKVASEQFTKLYKKYSGKSNRRYDKFDTFALRLAHDEISASLLADLAMNLLSTALQVVLKGQSTSEVEAFLKEKAPSGWEVETIKPSGSTYVVMSLGKAANGNTLRVLTVGDVVQHAWLRLRIPTNSGGSGLQWRALLSDLA